MKIKNKINLLAILVFSIFTTFAIAQETATKNYDQKFKLGIGANIGYAVNNPYKLALGADARLQYDLSKRYSVTLTTGFSNLFITGTGNDLGIIPAKLGFKAFIWEDQFYIMGEAGGAWSVTNSYNKNSYLLSPSIGYATKYIDISMRYEHYLDFPVLNSNGTIGTGLGQVALRVAYGFEL
ncbi:MAG: hypothetical protein H7174_04900 [Flavobacterium sp.]|nr:hypothetical protein [Flavobacterium sp.]